MSIVQEESALAADQKAIDDVQAVAERLTPAGKRKLLARIAKTCLTGDVYDVPLADDEGDVFAYVNSTKKPVIDFSTQFSKEELAAIVKNLNDPRYLMTVEEMLARLDAEDDRTDPQP
jgi:hypothetical protein